MLNFRVIFLLVLISAFASCKSTPKLGYYCTGTEPFWTITFEKGEFYFNSMDGGEPVNLGYAEPVIKANHRKILYTFNEGELSLEPATQGCPYDMSGEGNFVFTATFVYNQIPYKGCAREVREPKNE